MDHYDPRRRPVYEERTRGERSSHSSPDWPERNAGPRYRDDRYYSRDRNDEHDDYSQDRPYRAEHERESAGEWRRAGNPGRWRGDQNRTTTPEQRSRGFVPRELDQRERASVWGREPDDMGPWTISGPHTGRGPKGYKRSDQQLVDEASQRLERDGHVDATDIEVSAEGGVIHLRGTVPDRASKRRAEECVESVYGARDVMNELRIADRSRVEEADPSRALSQDRPQKPSQKPSGLDGSKGMPKPPQ
jgi:hypothetical protein